MLIDAVSAAWCFGSDPGCSPSDFQADVLGVLFLVAIVGGTIETVRWRRRLRRSDSPPDESHSDSGDRVGPPDSDSTL
jgi:hypothetical protein